jgi:subtilisin family serine protease
MRKLDLPLGQMYRDKVQAPASVRAAAPEPLSAGASPASDEVHVTVHFTGPASDLEAAGLTITAVVGPIARKYGPPYTIASGRVCLARLAELAAIDHVLFVEGPRSVSGQLNYSAQEIQATVLRQSNPELTGKGVIVAVIDSGIDWRHGSFVKDGKTRILAIRDQVQNVEYTQQQIQQALDHHTPLNTEDVEIYGEKRHGHGSHVAGIAAGDGSPATCCQGGSKYVGIAPEANILVVRLRADSTGHNFLEALDYIVNQKDVKGNPPAVPARPVVVNLSVTSGQGPRDGTDSWELAIDQFVSSAPGRIMVVSAGNNAGHRRHATARVPSQQSLELTFETKKNDLNSRNLDLWYFHGSQLDLEVTGPNGSTSGPVKDGAPTQTFTANLGMGVQRTVMFTYFLGLGPNHDNRIRLQLQRQTGGAATDSQWKLKLSNPYPADVEFHCWFEDNDPLAPSFISPESAITDSTTLATPATAKQAIAVTRYNGRESGSDCCPSRDIASDSSRGPVRGDAQSIQNNPKPTIAAPGRGITSARADAANLSGNCCDCCPDFCCPLYESLSGTSQAAPHVAGAVALLLQVDPALTRDQIVDYLNGAANKPSGADPNEWGSGVLDIAKAVGKLKADRAKTAASAGVTLLATGTTAASRSARPSGRTDPAAFAAMPPAVEVLRARARALPDGERCAAAISRHFSEVRRLINTNKRVATMWHRSEGPQLLRRLLHGMHDPHAEPPVRSEEQRAYLSRFFDQLLRFGSTKLAASIEKHGDLIVTLLERQPAAQITVTDRIV